MYTNGKRIIEFYIFHLRQEIQRRDSLWRAVERKKLKKRAHSDDKENEDARNDNKMQGKLSTRLKALKISSNSIIN